MSAFKEARSIALAAVFCFAVSPASLSAAGEVDFSGDNGFDADSIADFVKRDSASGTDSFGFTADQYARRNFLYRVANQFRVAGAIDPQRLAESFAPDNPELLAGLLDSKASRRAPGIWRYFFRQSLIYAGRVDAPVSRIGFYNPIVDGWVMTDWLWSEKTIRLARVRIVAGESLLGRDSRGGIRIGWTRPSRLSLIDRLRGAAGLAGLAFAKAHPMTASTAPPATRLSPADARSQLRLEARLLGVLANLNIHYQDPEKAAISTALIDAMKIGDKEALMPIAGAVSSQSLHVIAGLPGAMRRNLELIGNFPTPSGAVMIFGMPMMSRWMVIARYTAPSDGTKGGIDGLAAFEITPQTPANRETNNAGL